MAVGPAGLTWRIRRQADPVINAMTC
jgi:hypothetical protein